MALITDRKAPADVPTTNALAALPDILDVPPAYFSLGSTPQPMENPPEIGEVVTLIMRAVCTGEGKTVRTDGELRYVRKFAIQAAWKSGDPEPPDADADQPGLFDEDGDPTDEPESIGDILDGVNRPGFSDADA